MLLSLLKIHLVNEFIQILLFIDLENYLHITTTLETLGRKAGVAVVYYS